MARRAVTEKRILDIPNQSSEKRSLDMRRDGKDGEPLRGILPPYALKIR